MKRRWEVWRFKGGRAVMVACFVGEYSTAVAAFHQASKAFPGERVRLQTDTGDL